MVAFKMNISPNIINRRGIKNEKEIKESCNILGNKKNTPVIIRMYPTFLLPAINRSPVIINTVGQVNRMLVSLLINGKGK